MDTEEHNILSMQRSHNAALTRQLRIVLIIGLLLRECPEEEGITRVLLYSGNPLMLEDAITR